MSDNISSLSHTVQAVDFLSFDIIEIFFSPQLRFLSFRIKYMDCLLKHTINLNKNLNLLQNKIHLQQHSDYKIHIFFH